MEQRDIFCCSDSPISQVGTIVPNHPRTVSLLAVVAGASLVLVFLYEWLASLGRDFWLCKLLCILFVEKWCTHVVVV